MAATLTPSTPPPPVLNGWKEIANYLGRGVRTVQRYEAQLSLPVKRVQGKSHSAVIALPKELDAWLKHCPMSDARLTDMQYTRGLMVLQVHQETMGKLKANLRVLKEKIARGQQIMADIEQPGRHSSEIFRCITPKTC